MSLGHKKKSAGTWVCSWERLTPELVACSVPVGPCPIPTAPRPTDRMARRNQGDHGDLCGERAGVRPELWMQHCADERPRRRLNSLSGGCLRQLNPLAGEKIGLLYKEKQAADQGVCLAGKIIWLLQKIFLNGNSLSKDYSNQPDRKAVSPSYSAGWRTPALRPWW